MLAGGGVGAIARYELDAHLAPPTPPEFPWVTFVINVSGSFALGALMTLLATVWVHTRHVKPLLATGVGGGFTTWSHFIIEADLLIQANQTAMAVAYIAASIVLGVVAAAAGAALAMAILRRHVQGESRWD